MDVVFKELGRLDETGNFGVLLTIIFVYVLYFLAIVLAKRADRKDQDKVKINEPENRCLYSGKKGAAFRSHSFQPIWIF